jgi:hypothetical protein
MANINRRTLLAALLALLLTAQCPCLAQSDGQADTTSTSNPWDQISGLLGNDENAVTTSASLEALFPDSALRAAVEAAARKASGKADGEITKDDLPAVTEMDLSGIGLKDITPLTNLAGLTSLNLSENGIMDVTPLAKLKKLTSLDLSENHLTDISPQEKLSKLEELFLSDNSISDTSPLWALSQKGCYITLRGNPTVEVLQHSPASTPMPAPASEPTPESTSEPTLEPSSESTPMKVPTPAPTPDVITNYLQISNPMGNGFLNYLEKGSGAISDGQFVYFINPSKGLYRMKQDGTELKKISNDGYLHAVTVKDDWVYYSYYASKGFICKIGKNGKNRKVIKSFKGALIGSVQVADDGYIYYIKYLHDTGDGDSTRRDCSV